MRNGDMVLRRRLSFMLEGIGSMRTPNDTGNSEKTVQIMPRWFYYYYYTRTWINVDSFWNYWTSKKHGNKPHQTFRTQRSVRRYAHEGDVIQFYEKKHGKKGGWFHSVVVHYKTRHDIYYTAHTSSHLHKGLRNANKGKSRRGIHKIIKYRVIHMGF